MQIIWAQLGFCGCMHLSFSSSSYSPSSPFSSRQPPPSLTLLAVPSFCASAPATLFSLHSDPPRESQSLSATPSVLMRQAHTRSGKPIPLAFAAFPVAFYLILIGLGYYVYVVTLGGRLTFRTQRQRMHETLHETLQLMQCTTLSSLCLSFSFFL